MKRKRTRKPAIHFDGASGTVEKPLTPAERKLRWATDAAFQKGYDHAKKYFESMESLKDKRYKEVTHILSVVGQMIESLAKIETPVK